MRKKWWILWMGCVCLCLLAARIPAGKPQGRRVVVAQDAGQQTLIASLAQRPAATIPDDDQAFIALAQRPGPVMPGAWRMDQYLPLLKGQRIAVFANQTSVIGTTHLIDTLLHLGINVVRIFSPEHGFRGTADAGESVAGIRDSATGIPIVSLYGKHYKPSASDLADVDVLLFDIQDVGVRFYTYISSLQYYMEAALENNKPLIVLDRPNPNGAYVDGPVLDTKFRSFVGMQPIPVVYGMTIGEYAKMLLGEGWLTPPPTAPIPVKEENGQTGAEKPGFRLTIIPCAHYTHQSIYSLPVKPSPNLPNMQSIYLYPSICWFEGTEVSLGRGTDKPFQCFGHPSLPPTGYSFTPRSTAGASAPPLKDKLCYGYDLSGIISLQKGDRRLQLKWLLEAYRLFPDKTAFFLKNNYFNKLAGNDQFMAQIKAGLSEQAIRQSWEPGIRDFMKIRAKYLLYP